MPTLSYIVPVYNSEYWIKSCLDSIRNQTFRDFECIIIDDGSTDESINICTDYENKDIRFKVISSANKGVSNARNVGILAAKGEYLQFVDSDDTISCNMSKILIENALLSKSDVIISNFYYIDNMVKTKQVLNDFESIQYDTDSFRKNFCKLLHETCAIEACWNKLYKMDTVKKCNAEFDVNINYGEDLLFNLSLYKSYNKISFIGKPLYNYYVRKKDRISLSQKYRSNLLIKEMHLLECIKRFLIDMEIEYNIYFYNYIEEHIVEGLNEYKNQQCNIDINQINSQLEYFFDSSLFSMLPNSIKENLKRYTENEVNCNKI